MQIAKQYFLTDWAVRRKIFDKENDISDMNKYCTG
jgi:hypothetical protein